MELQHKPSNELKDSHQLGVFVSMTCLYCIACVAGKGSCCHCPERLWYQFHHWTDKRHGIDRSTTLGACSWARGGRFLNFNIRQNICEQHTVKHKKLLVDQGGR